LQLAECESYNQPHRAELLSASRPTPPRRSAGGLPCRADSGAASMRQDDACPCRRQVPEIRIPELRWPGHVSSGHGWPERFQCGVLIYAGENVLPFGEKLYALPLRCLWEAEW